MAYICSARYLGHSMAHTISIVVISTASCTFMWAASRSSRPYKEGFVVQFVQFARRKQVCSSKSHYKH